MLITIGLLRVKKLRRHKMPTTSQWPLPYGHGGFPGGK